MRSTASRWCGASSIIDRLAEAAGEELGETGFFGWGDVVRLRDRRRKRVEGQRKGRDRAAEIAVVKIFRALGGHHGERVDNRRIEDLGNRGSFLPRCRF